MDTGREGSFSALSGIQLLFLLLMILALYPSLPQVPASVAILPRAAQVAASGTATEADEALLLIENKRMNHLAMEG